MAETPVNPEAENEGTPDEAVEPAGVAAEQGTDGDPTDAAPHGYPADAGAAEPAATPTPPRSAEDRQAERDAARKQKAAQRRRRRAKAKTKRDGASAGEGTPPREHGEGRPKVRQGIVTSDKADKTITVRIDTARRHRRYEKIVRSSSTLHAHDEANDASAGDTVRVVESRPLSRTKRWRLLDVVERAR